MISEGSRGWGYAQSLTQTTAKQAPPRLISRAPLRSRGSGTEMVLITFAYLITWNGERAGHGEAGEPLRVPQPLHFHNSAGGTMYLWGCPDENLVCECGWDRQQHSFVIRENTASTCSTCGSESPVHCCYDCCSRHAVASAADPHTG